MQWRRLWGWEREGELQQKSKIIFANENEKIIGRQNFKLQLNLTRVAKIHTIIMEKEL